MTKTISKNDNQIYSHVLEQIDIYGDYYEALFMISLDETHGDIQEAVKIADRAVGVSSRSRFKKEFREGGYDIPVSSKSLTQLQVGNILTKQYFNAPKNYSPGRMIRHWITSKQFHLIKNVPLWCIRPYKYEAPDDLSHSVGPLIIDANKKDRDLVYGSFGSLNDFVIADGKHRYWMAIRAGDQTRDCFVGDVIRDQLKQYIKAFSPLRTEFIKSVYSYYNVPNNENSYSVYESGSACGLSHKQIDMIFSNFDKGIKFNFAYGQFEDEGFRE